ncbi:uncharacterized protein LOC115685264 isoform X1 [Syzygium oleosum]|uniref:uncharacterized protein LOC115685264 isoform X1 n=2 Tax=Syzygium oleosum TaxID=219896 RepID=UPI0024BBD4E0|nr:uncharacterized protein LOC115685264 isoform X1 [Syzygium oleosum]
MFFNRMGTDNERSGSEMEKMLLLYKSFMARVTKFDEATSAGSRFLVSFQQGLEFVRRPALDRSSNLLKNIIKANETERLTSYFNAGCIHANDGSQSLTKLHTCVLGLHSLVNTAKTILIELEGLLEDVIKVLEAANEYLLPSQDEDIDARLMGEATNADEEETASSDSRRPELTEYATMMGVIYSMIKQDFVMQEKIVSALNLKLSSGELETYCTIWSLRPFIDDEIMHQAWSFIP